MGLCESVEPTKDGELTIIHPTNSTWWQAGQLLIVVVHRPIPVCWALDPVCSPWLQAWPKTLAVDTKTCTGETENQPKWMFIPKKYGFERYWPIPKEWWIHWSHFQWIPLKTSVQMMLIFPVFYIWSWYKMAAPVLSLFMSQSKCNCWYMHHKCARQPRYKPPSQYPPKNPNGGWFVLLHSEKAQHQSWTFPHWYTFWQQPSPLLALGLPHYIWA